MSPVHRFISRLVVLSVLPFASQQSCAGVSDAVSVLGPQRLLVVAVRFPGTGPTQTLDQIRDKIGRVDRYIRSASYGKAWLEPKLSGWHDMPAPVGDYSVSPHNFQVDRSRVRRLVSDRPRRRAPRHHYRRISTCGSWWVYSRDRARATA